MTESRLEIVAGPPAAPAVHRAAMHRAAALAVLVLAACGSSDTAPPPARTVYAAYVVLAPGADGDTLALARVIVEPGDPDCPALRGERGSRSMVLRGNPFGFPVNVCEARIPFGRRFRVAWTDQPLPVARRRPQRLTIVGDTGCHAADCPAGTPASPFAALAVTAAQLPSDLIIHVGDYMYRGTPSTIAVNGTGSHLVYDAGDNTPDDPTCQLDSPYVSQNAGYSDVPDSWEQWRDDFFVPAAPLLAAAPWVFVRGNHELCSRAGPGWFTFLDAGAAPRLGGVGEHACPPQGTDAPLPPPVLPYLVFTPPYVLDLGSIRLAVIDSANACDDYAPTATTERYRDQLGAVLAAAPSHTPTWIATHRPFWAATDLDGASVALTLQEAWADARAAQSGAPVALALAGHVHAFQSVTFPAPGSDRPPQLVVGGDTGVALSTTSPVGAFDAIIDQDQASVLGLREFGFLHVASLAADGSWSGAMVDGSGTAIADCGTDNLPGSLCVR